jgi:8-oxo-dGTP pyrophosphatase MutT (NUDIX family)
MLEGGEAGRLCVVFGHEGCIIGSVSINAYRDKLLASLRTHAPADAIEAGHLAVICAFVADQTAPFDRETFEGHVTASAFIVDPTRLFTLLVWHEKLARWLQPGGHCEKTDDSTLAAAEREIEEETGLGQAQLTRIGDGIFDVDAHRIPARRDIPEHWHFDIRYLFEAHRAAPTSVGANWVSIDQMLAHPHASLRRLAEKVAHAH